MKRSIRLRRSDFLSSIVLNRSGTKTCTTTKISLTKSIQCLDIPPICQCSIVQRPALHRNLRLAPKGSVQPRYDRPASMAEGFVPQEQEPSSTASEQIYIYNVISEARSSSQSHGVPWFFRERSFFSFLIKIFTATRLL